MERYIRVIGGIAYDRQRRVSCVVFLLPQWVQSQTAIGAFFGLRREQPLDDARDGLFDE